MNWHKELTRVWTLLLGAAAIAVWYVFFDWPFWSLCLLCIVFAICHARWIERRFGVSA